MCPRWGLSAHGAVMTPHYADAAVTVYAGDCLELLREMPSSSVDAVVTDPPFGLEFMGAEWDSFKPSSARLRTRVDGRTNPTHGKSTTTTPEAYVAGEPFQQWCQAWATECLRLLKPGGHLLAFGGTRTWHHLATGVECAGFELRDSIAWLYGGGFPKSLDVSKAIDRQHRRTDRRRDHVDDSVADAARRWEGWGTALKPAFGPVVVARKPLSGTVAHNVMTHGTGALHIDGCRIDGRERTEYGLANSKRTRVSTYGIPSESADFDATKGRWPANVVLDETTAAEVDRQSGATRSRIGKHRGTVSGAGWGTTANGTEYDDEGGASRFFYIARASTAERPMYQPVRLRLRADLTSEQMDRVTTRLQEEGVDVA